ncbi:MAG: helix-turn-helix domain-containing protein [Gammaproteobacteria bacterium]|jgi:transcriptional regulator GlxA family with amidase domain|nr:helix-turn-helix domain-containing protein [Gammaproteobacteria bacterium]MBQ0774912.1 helix-turn-helix domain-containing protein [Gammaproteobacteria bacterium]|tara:strand:- start:70585 stop:71565 length:981 start_codon:yes stop_codon:yes gene_type:complete
MTNVTVFAMDNILATGVTGPIEVLNIANIQADIAGVDAHQRFSWQILSVDGKPVRSSAGFMIPVDGDIKSAYGSDIIIIPGFNHTNAREVTDFVANMPDGYISWLKARQREGKVLCGICSGTFVLAEAGLLDSKISTTSWWLTKAFRRRYPAAHLHPKDVVTEDGNMICGAGATSWAHVALRLVDRYMPTHIAGACARIMLLDRGTSQAPYLKAEHLTSGRDAAIERVIEYMRANVGNELPLAQLSDMAAMSDRTFVRRFRSVAGMPPGQYLQKMRLDIAKHLLEETDQPLERIVLEVGYSDVSSFRRLFKKEVSVSPSAFRERFK